MEKPVEWVGDQINAGLYIFNTSMIKRIPDKPTSIERETFPAMAMDKQLVCYTLPGYWMDIGQPRDYAAGVAAYLKWHEERKNEELAKGDNIKGNVIVHPTAQIHPEALIGPDVIIGEGCVVGPGTWIYDSTIMKGTKIGKSCLIRRSIVGSHCTIKNWVRIENLSVIAEDC